jgi:exosortase
MVSTSPSESAASGTGVTESILASAAGLVALALCVPMIGALHWLWSDLEYYGHAYAIPVTAAYLAFSNRRNIQKALRHLDPPRFGPLVAFAAATVEIVAFIGDVGFAAGLGIPLVLGAAAYAIGGKRLLRELSMPILFLALMIPPPQFVLFKLLFHLKLVVTAVAVVLVRFFFDTPILAEGNQLLLPDTALFVADACSGLNSIVTMIPLACIVSYFLSRGIWRRCVIVASVVPLAMGVNIFRVVATVRMVSYLGVEAAQGALHESFGIATYVVGTLALVGIARVLK